MITQNQYQLSKMDPRDALPFAHRAIRGEVGVQRDKLHDQARRSTVASTVNLIRPTTGPFIRAER